MTATMEPQSAAAEHEVGRSRRRKEDDHLITGRTKWTDNIVLPGMLHLAILRSPLAHARITSIDTSAAKETPGVVAVYTGADFAEEQGSLPNAWPITPDMKSPPAPSLAVDTVNFAGEAVAVVVARDAYAAHDALKGIDVDYEDLPVVLDLAAAAEDGADLVHPARHQQERHLGVRLRRSRTGTDVDEEIRNAEVVVQRTFRPTAADTGVHGAALGGRRPDRTAVHHVVVHPGAAHPETDAGDDARHPRAQASRDRARRRRRVRRQAAGVPERYSRC